MCRLQIFSNADISQEGFNRLLLSALSDLILDIDLVFDSSFMIEQVEKMNEKDELQKIKWKRRGKTCVESWWYWVVKFSWRNMNFTISRRPCWTCRWYFTGRLPFTQGNPPLGNFRMKIDLKVEELLLKSFYCTYVNEPTIMSERINICILLAPQRWAQSEAYLIKYEGFRLYVWNNISSKIFQRLMVQHVWRYWNNFGNFARALSLW